MTPRLLLPAMERVAYQANSPLARDLTAVFTTALAEVAKSRPADAGYPTPPRVEQVVTILTRTLAPIPGIVKARTGLSLIVTLDRAVGLHAWSFRHIAGTTLEQVNAARHQATGLSGGVAVPKLVQQIFAVVAQDLDHDRGTLTGVASTAVLATVMLSVGFFVMPEVWHNIEPLTAEEIAAVFTHELGHTITSLELLARLQHRSEIVANSVRYISEHAKPQDAAPLVAEVRAHLAKAPINQADRRVMEAILANVNSDTLDPGVIEAILMSVLNLSLGFFLSPIINGLMADLSTLGANKNSDVMVTKRAATEQERLADDYAARHGLGPALATAVVKVNQADAVGVKKTGVIGAARNTTRLVTLAESFRALNTVFTMPVGALCSAYEPEIQRLNEIMQANMVFFKDPQLDPAVRDRMVSSTQAALDTINAHRARNHVKLREFLWGTLLRMTTSGTLVGAVKNANLAADYEKLQRITGRLLHTQLYFHAAALQRHLR